MKLSGLPLLALISPQVSALSRVEEPLVLTIEEPVVGDSCTCESDYDCQRPKCIINPYSKVGTCGAGPVGPPVSSPTPPPIPPTDCCPTPKKVPTECEVEILISLLDIAISGDHKLAAQWLRLAFHDAGTFNTVTNEGGANGCLMTDEDFLLQPENGFLDIPVNALRVIKHAWEALDETCIAISSADMIQFAGLFASLRQVEPTGINVDKTATLKEFEWGRLDEENCDTEWCDNLPGFSFGIHINNIQARCLKSGEEIKKKMMERNGFSAEESAALIGAHTIGLTRNSFGSGHANPWVPSGRDSATTDGPLFNNEFHDFLINGIVENTVNLFAGNIDPFDVIFPDWFKDTDGGMNHLDTDIALALPSQDTGVHPDFRVFTNAFANDNDLFLEKFFLALEKMGKLGVSVILSPPTACSPCDGDGTLETRDVLDLFVQLGEAKAEAEDTLRIKQESDSFVEVREDHLVEVKEEKILSVDDAIKEIEKVLSAETTLEKETILEQQTIKKFTP